MDSKDRTLENFIRWIDSDPEPEVIEEIPVEVKESQVIAITGENENELEDGIWMVAFCAPWGVHCEKLQEEWKELSTIATEYKVGIVDTTQEKEIAEKYKITAVPAIKMIYNGEVFDHWGGRSVQTYDGFAKTKIEEKNPKPPKIEPEGICRITSDVVELTLSNFESKTAGNDFFVEFYAPWCNFCAELEPILAELADNSAYNVGKIDAIANAELRFKYRIAGYPTLLLLKADGSTVRYRGDRTVELFSAFLDEHLYPDTEQDHTHEEN